MVDPSPSDGAFLAATNGIFILGPGITFRGGHGTTGASGLPLITSGDHPARTAASTLTVLGSPVTTHGTLGAATVYRPGRSVRRAKSTLSSG